MKKVSFKNGVFSVVIKWIDYEKVDCLKKENLNKFLLREIMESERNALETHLADCSDCRFYLTELYAEREFFAAPIALKEKAKQIPSEKEKAANPFFSFFTTWQKAFAVASFAVLFGLVGFWVWNNEQVQTVNDKDVMRNGEETSENSTKLLSPENNANLTSEEIEFKWGKISDAISYILIISDEKGDIVFEKQTKVENINVKTAAANLVSAKQYFWYVRTKFVDGKITETEPRKFTFKK